MNFPTGVLCAANSVDSKLKVFGVLSSEFTTCLLYTSDAADERSSVDLGGRRIIKKKNRGPSKKSRHNYKKKHNN